MASYDDTATVSGSIVRVNDGADSVPLKNWLVTLPASLDGYSEVNAVQTGKNLLNPTYLEDGYSLGANGLPTLVAKRIATTTAVPIHGGNITISYSTSVNTVQFMYATFVNGALIERVAGKANGSTINAQNADEIYISLYDTQSSDITGGSIVTNVQIEVGSTATSYEAYEAPTQYTASLGRTIYGGTADIVNGQGSNGSILIDLSELTWNMDNDTRFRSRQTDYTGASGWSGSWQNTVSNRFVCENPATAFTNRSDYSFANIPQNYYNFDIKVPSGIFADATAFKTWLGNIDGNGTHAVVVIDRLNADPFTFTPVSIETSKGSNTFWSDQGDSELTYYKDGYGTTSVTIHKETPDGEPVEQTAKLHKIVYEGQVDVVTGKGTTNYKNFKLSDLTWSGGVIGGQMWCWYVDLSTEGLKLPANSEIFDGLCDSYTPIRYNAIATNANTIALRNNGYLYVNNGSDTVKPTGNVLITLATPAEFTFPPISMETDEGENTLYADEGDSAITYRKAVE